MFGNLWKALGSIHLSQLKFELGGEDQLASKLARGNSECLSSQILNLPTDPAPLRSLIAVYASMAR
jgi:hypothetical protein